MGVMKPDMIMKSLVPIIMAGILGIYGLIVAVILLQKSKIHIGDIFLVDPNDYSKSKGYKHLVAGMCCGFSALVSFSIFLCTRRLGSRSGWSGTSACA